MKYLFIICAIVAVAVGIMYFRSGVPATISTPTPSASSLLATPSPTPTPKPLVSHTPTPSAELIVHEAKIYYVIAGNFTFNPSSVTVHRGDVVIFQNTDSVQHTVTSDTGAFDQVVGSGQQIMLETANMALGTYQYHCSIHTNMRGTIIIQ